MGKNWTNGDSKIFKEVIFLRNRPMEICPFLGKIFGSQIWGFASLGFGPSARASIGAIGFLGGEQLGTWGVV